MASHGFRFFIAHTGPDDLAAEGLGAAESSLKGDTWAPLISPFNFTPWPAGWVGGSCQYGCPKPPRKGCVCGLTVMLEMAQLAWWHLVHQAGAWVNDPRSARRMVITRVALRGRLLPHARPARPSFEYQAERGKVVEMWVPQAATRFVPLLSEHYGVPINVGASDGEAWLRELCPVLPDVPDPFARYRNLTAA